MVGREGVSGVSHRAVAREAGLPATAAAYYFQSIDALLTAALTRSMDEDAERMRRLADGSDGGVDSVRGLAELLVKVLTDRARLLAEYELYLMAARDRELRESTDRWLTALAEFARRHTPDPIRVDVFVGLIDGVLLQGLLRDEPANVERFEAMLRAVLDTPARQRQRRTPRRR